MIRILVCSLFLCGSVLAESLVLAENGVSRAVIVTTAAAGEPDFHAAEELSKFLGQISGGKFPLVAQPSATAVNIFVGPGAAKIGDPSFTTEGLGSDGTVIRSVPKGLILAGGYPRGTLYAVYSFLEEDLGCLWLTPKTSVIPKRAVVQIESLDRRFVPVFERREVMFSPNTADADWSVRNKCYGELHGYGQYDIMYERGGAAKAHPPGHSYFYVVPPDQYFQKHPEWFSLINGKRTGTPSIHASLCLTNPQMKAEFLSNLRREVREAPKTYSAVAPQYEAYVKKAKNPFMFVAVSPEDDSGYPNRCQCEKCVAIEKREGSPAGLNLQFANEMARSIKSEFPEKSVYLYAYHYTQKPPLISKPESGMAILFAPINASFSKPLSDDRNSRWREDLLGWLKISDRVYLYDYPANVTYEQVPHPNLRVVAENIRYLADKGGKGYIGEGIMNTGTGGTELSELRAWVIAKLMWNPLDDLDRLIKVFTEAYYGQAAGEVVAYLNVFERAVADSGDWLDLSSPPEAKFLLIESLTEAWAHLQKAEQLAKGNPELLKRVQNLQLPALFVFLVRWNELADSAANRHIEWPLAKTRQESYERFMAIAEANGVTLSPQSAALLAKKEKVRMVIDGQVE